MTNLTTPTFPAVVFSVTDAGIAELEAKHRGLVVAHGDKKGYLALTQAIAEVRTAIVCATLKAPPAERAGVQVAWLEGGEAVAMREAA